ncbi:MAG: amino acid adenylation domain-containing protein [Planctomycetota bacterium]|nr:MAG: amino acid adenylation domain-containing protein [Planctomycetota bacterium]
MADAPDVAIDSFDLLSDADRHRVTFEFNDTAVDIGPPATLDRLFREQARRTPGGVALWCEGLEVSFAELDASSDRLAGHLASLGVGAGGFVGVFLERSIEFVVAVLGILKAGCGYAPLPADHPAERIAFMIEDAGLTAIVTCRGLAGLLPVPATSRVLVDADEAWWHQEHLATGLAATDGAKAAYVMYTSGSTGRPKGVVVPHRAVVRLVRGQSYADFGPELRTLLLAPTAFDASTFELWSPLLSGGTCVIFRDRMPGIMRLAKVVREGRVNCLWLTASLFNHVIDGDCECLATVGHVITGGEALSIAHVRRALINLPGIRLSNGYGPTEATTFTSMHAIDPHDAFHRGNVPIGRPLANTTCYVVDDSLRLVGVGVTGELLIGGDGLALGYLGQPELTAEKFIPDPFGGRPSARLYRTGDMCRWMEDGNLEYLGRRDQQVKIRGYRIELAEIEAELARIEGVARAVVIDREVSPGDRRLVAYLVTEAHVPDDDRLRALLAARLPEVMVPWRFLRLDAFPITANGKLDRGALPLPDAVAATGDDKAFSAPFGEVEEGLAAIWCELLGIPSVGRNEGFFELGGHSLLAMRLVAAVERRFGVRLPLRSVFKTPRLADIATRIAQAPTSLVESKVSFATIPAGDSVVNCSPLPAQRGMWLLDALLPDRAASNVPLAWRVVGMIDWPRMERALLAVAARHPGLRTGLVEVDGELVQRVLPAAQAAVAWREIAVAAVESLPAALCEEARIPFDLAVAPLLRGVRFNVEGADPVLMITFHHAVFDEWSAGVLRDDLAVAYLSDGPLGVGSLPIVTVSHAPEKLDQQRTFWREELASAPPETPLPRTSLVTPTTKGRTHRFGLDGAAVDRLRTLSSASGVTLFNFLLASCHAWVQRVTGENDIVIGTPVATRGASDTAAAVGCLINVLPIRVRWDIGGVTSGVTMGQLAARVQEIFLRALDHADLPFHQIVAAAVQERRGNRQPLVNILFTLVETGNRVWRVGPAALHPLGVDTGISRFDLSLTVEISPHGMECALEASADLLDQDTVAGLASRYEALLLEMLAGPMVPVERMEMLSVGERRLVIDQWNSTTVELGSPATLHQLVAEQAAKTPAAVAVRDGGQAVTYAQLELRAAQLASRLRARGIGSGMRVGIAVPRSIEAVVSVLGILRSGAAWVPLDRNWPPARLAMIAADAGLAAIIDCGESSSPWPGGMAILDPSGLGEADWDGDDAGDVDPRAPAYVMYTSGSTGHPKGVVIPHAAAVNYLRGKQHRFPLEATDVVLHSTGTTFDISLYELFGPLLAGASVVIAPPGRSDPFQIAHLVRGAGVTVAQFVPSLLGILVEDETFTSSPTLRRVFCGGEAMPPLLMRMFLDRSAAELVNVYGPTEATVWATAWVCQRNDHDRSPPIGRPLDNVRCYVLDSAARPVPSGVVGELYIGGEQLAVGYHDRPELTAERFLPDPHCGRLGGRMYRTGDACLWRKDGQLEFIARTDQQVKIRGHRIELGEIEACLAGHPAVAGVAVVVVGDTPAELGGLTACVVARDATPAAEDLRRWTAERLPEAMVPTRFVGIAALPLNTNGKIDRPALAQLARTAPTGIPPRGTPFPERLLTGLETEIRAAWQRVFGRIDIGPDDDFFAIGGHSLVALRLVAGLGATLGRRVPVSLVFEAPTVVAQARALGDGSWKPRYDSLVPMQPLGDGPAVFFIHGVMGGVSSYLEIARELAPEIPVYGLQAIDRDGHHPQHPTAEAMVEHYATEIRSFQPCGPYVVTGFCAGGWLAYGVARELRKRGDEVRLVLLETHGNCRVTWRAWWRWMSRLVPELVVKHTRRLGRLSVAQWPRYLLDRILPMMGLRPGMARGPIPADRQERPATPEEQVNADPYLPAITRLRIDPVDFDIVHIGVLGELASSAELFRGLTTGTCTACRLPGTHHEILRHPNAVAVAAIFRRCLLDAAARSDSAGPSRS